MTYRNPTLLALAQLAPHCMGCGAANHGQVVSAHSNQGRDGKGASLKASDAAVAFMCDVCHHAVDAGRTDRVSATALWEHAHRATMRWLIESGQLVVCETTIVQIPAPKPKIKAKIGGRKTIQGRGFDKPDVPRKIAPRPFGRRP